MCVSDRVKSDLLNHVHRTVNWEASHAFFLEAAGRLPRMHAPDPRRC